MTHIVLHSRETAGIKRQAAESFFYPPQVRFVSTMRIIAQAMIGAKVICLSSCRYLHHCLVLAMILGTWMMMQLEGLEGNQIQCRAV